MSPIGDRAELDIRAAYPEDGDEVVKLWNVTRLTRWWNDPPGDFHEFRTAANAEVLVGTIRGQLIASICVGHDGHRGWMYYLAVHPNHQGRGYGRQLLRAAELWLSERGLRKANVMIRAENRDAIGFYRALGYTSGKVNVMSHWLSKPPLPPDNRAEADDDGKLEVTVTYLEMTEPPSEPAPPAPAGRKVALMRAERPVVSFYRFLYDTVGRRWLWWERRALDDRTLANIVQDDRVEIYVIYIDGAPAGFAELDRRREPDVELAYFGLVTEYIGMGFGPYLLRAAIDLAWRTGPRKVTVRTNTLDHPKALTLYQRFGFRPVRQETETIDDPRLTGLIPLE